MTTYAIKKNDAILTHTIAQWRRAVIVTYLLQDMGQSIFCTDTDEHVENLWCGMANGAEVVEVKVSETAAANPESFVDELETAIGRELNPKEKGQLVEGSFK